MGSGCEISRARSPDRRSCSRTDRTELRGHVTSLRRTCRGGGSSERLTGWRYGLPTSRDRTLTSSTATREGLAIEYEPLRAGCLGGVLDRHGRDQLTVGCAHLEALDSDAVSQLLRLESEIDRTSADRRLRLAAD